MSIRRALQARYFSRGACFSRVPRLESLEERCVLSASLAWPAEMLSVDLAAELFAETTHAPDHQTPSASQHGERGSQSETVQANTGVAMVQFAQGPVLDTIPEPTVEQQALFDAANRQGPLPDAPPFIPNVGATIATSAALATPADPVSDPPPESLAPGDLRFFRNSVNRPSGGSYSPTNEPSVGTLDEVVFTTGNWYASISSDNGSTFSHVDPETTFPEDWGGFCCDQRVAHDPGRDLVLWYLQYVKTGSSSSDTNGVRIARANTTADLEDNSWDYWDFTPVDFNLGSGKWLDFPHMQLTDDYAYFTSNVYSTVTNNYIESVLWRISLSQLEAGGTVNYSWIVRSDGTIGLPAGATDTMYAATVSGLTNSIRVLTWPDSSGTVTIDLVSGLSTTFYGTHTSYDNNGYNWTGRSDSRVLTGWVSGNELAFMWNSAQGTGRPKPFVRTVVMNASTKVVSSEPDIWHSTDTWHYPAFASNARGHIAGTVGVNGENGPVLTNVIIDDDFTAGWEAHFGAGGTDGPMQNRWGDYLASLPDDNFPNTWVATGFSHSGSTTTPSFFWFGRERDAFPDLRGSFFNVVQEPLDAGDTFDVDFTIENPEVGAAGAFDVDFYLSTNTIISTLDRLLGSRSIASLAGLGATALTQTLTLPGAGDPFWAGDGQYTIGMIVDTLSSVFEADESNNSNEGGLVDSDNVSITVGVVDDHGNDAGTSTPIGVPSTTAGDIEQTGDEDWFSFAAVGGGVYTIETMLVSLGDSELTLYGTNGTTQLDYDDDGGVGLASKIVWTAPTNGTYYVKVNEYDDNQTGTYSLDISVVQPDDHGDDAGTATPVGVPSTTGGVIEQPGDEDWFSFTAVDGGVYTIETTLVSLGDSELTLYGTNGTTQLDYDDDGGEGLASKIIWTAPANGTYYVKVNEDGDNATGAYSVGISISDLTTITFTIGQNFTGSNRDQSYFIPPDTMGAVGPNHVVELINGRFAVYTKTGTLQTGSSLDAFWIASGVTPANYSFDPRIVYDKVNDRWFATAVDNPGAANNFLMAISDTGNPAGTWTGFQIDSDSDNSHWADFPMIGMNQDVIVVNANMFGLGPAPPAATTSTLVIPKSDLLLATPTVANATLFENTNPSNSGFSQQPILDYDNGSLPLPILSSINKPAGFLKTSSIGGTAASPTINTGSLISVTARGAPPDIDQPGPKVDIDGGDNRFSGNVVMQHIPGRTNPSLWGVHGVEISGRAAIEWYEIDSVTNVLLQSGTVSDPVLGCNYPSIAVNDFGTVVIGFSCGGEPTTYMSTYAMVGETVGGVTTFAPFFQTKAGVADYQRLDGNGRNRWGDYSATVVDPSDEYRFWTFQEFVGATDRWDIQITEIVTTPVGELDFGDAPDTYLTTLAVGGARHLATGPLLGVSRDAEADASTPLDGTGDDVTGTPDEDGVAFPNPLVAGTTPSVTVTSAVGGTLDYFFDFDGSGAFGDGAGEVFTFAHPGGAVAVPVVVPAGATIGSTFARFRLNSGTSVGWAGFAADGEVEDYAVSIVESTTDDHGNDAGTSTPVGVPSTTGGVIEVLGDQDWFSFAALDGGIYTIETTLISLGDSELTLYGTDGTTQLDYDDNGGVGLASKIVWTAPANGTYYVKVNEDGDNATGSYSLGISVAADENGPRVIAMSVPGAPLFADSIDVTFDEAINAGTFTTSDVTLTGPSGAISPTSVSPLGGNSYQVSFPNQTTPGTYTVTIGPDITDTSGNPMNQDGDSVNGEPTDSYVGNFSLGDVTSVYYFSLVAPGRVTSSDGSQLRVDDSDILQIEVEDDGTFSYGLIFDGSDVGLSTGGEDIDGFSIADDGSLFISTKGNFNVTGPAGTISGKDEDILRFIPSTLGPNTAGTWEFYFDGSDVGLTEDVDALSILPDGRIIVSTTGNVTVPGVTGKDEDLLAFTAITLGADTQGTWEFYFDGSDIGLTAGAEDIDAVHVGPANGSTPLLLSTVGNFAIGSLVGKAGDVLRFNADTLGGATTGSFESEFVIDGSEMGLRSYNIDGISQGGAAFWATDLPNLDDDTEPKWLPYREDLDRDYTFNPQVVDPTGSHDQGIVELFEHESTAESYLESPVNSPKIQLGLSDKQQRGEHTRSVGSPDPSAVDELLSQWSLDPFEKVKPQPAFKTPAPEVGSVRRD